jgi:hypothetical protein
MSAIEDPERPIQTALDKLWWEWIEKEDHDMVEVLLEREQQRAFHMEMRDLCLSQAYEYDRDQMLWKWRGMPIRRPEDCTTGHSVHASLAESTSGVGISLRRMPA